jgi:hypothetical protein
LNASFLCFQSGSIRRPPIGYFISMQPAGPSTMLAAPDDPVAASCLRFREYVEREFRDLPPNTVVLNVYDITWANNILSPLGLGVHHTGIEVYGREYSYGRATSGTGVFEVAPKKCAPHLYRESIVLGTTKMSNGEIRQLIGVMSGEWHGRAYHIARKNCNIFSGAFALEILTRDGAAVNDEHYGTLGADVLFDGPRGTCGVLPVWVNRLSDVGVQWFPRACDRVDALDRDSR